MEQALVMYVKYKSAHFRTFSLSTRSTFIFWAEGFCHLLTRNVCLELTADEIGMARRGKEKKISNKRRERKNSGVLILRSTLIQAQYLPSAARITTTELDEKLAEIVMSWTMATMPQCLTL